jgi:hypothetical protein
MAKNTIFIACDAHGVAGAGVEITQLKLQRDIKAVKKQWTKEQAKKLHTILANTLSAMLPEIMAHGCATDAYGEFYTKETFDQDLVCLAIYDHIGNGKQISLMNPRVYAFGNLNTIQ